MSELTGPDGGKDCVRSTRDNVPGKKFCKSKSMRPSAAVTRRRVYRIFIRVLFFLFSVHPFLYAGIKKYYIPLADSIGY